MARELGSFAGIVKEEITSKPFSDERLLATFAAFAKMNGRFIRNKEGTRLTLTTEYSKIAKFMYGIVLKLFKIHTKFAYTHTLRFNKILKYQVVIDQGVDTILEAVNLGFVEEEDNYLNKLKSNDAIAGYLTGLFLASGSVNHPESSHYHLEMSAPDESYLKAVLAMVPRLKGVAFDFKLASRRNLAILYLKRSDQIANFLILMGATDATLEYENIRVARDYANSDHRWQICETANMKKTVEAAESQRQDLLLIKKVVGLEALPTQKMVLLAKLRLKHDASSLLELAEMLSDQLGKPVSKSNINHLFRAIKTIAQDLRKAHP